MILMDKEPTTQEPTSFDAPNPFAIDAESIFSQAPAAQDAPLPDAPTPAADQPPTQAQPPEPADDDDDDPPPPAKPDDGALTPEKAAYIAEQKKSRKILREERDAERARLAELSTKQSEWQAARELAEQRAKDLEEQLKQRDELYRQAAVPKYDPAADPEVIAIRDQLKEAFQDVAAELDGANRDELSSKWWALVDDYEKARGAMSLKQFKNELADQFPGEEVDSIYNLIKDSVPKIRKSEALRIERETTHSQRVQQFYADRRQKAVEYVTKFGEWTDAQIAENPLDAQAIITRIARDNPEVKQQIKSLAPKYANLMAGNPPLAPDAPAAALIAHREAQRELETMQAAAPMLFFERPILQKVIAQQQQELEQLRARVGAVTEAKRPGAGFQPEKEPKKADDVSGYDAPNPYL